MMKTVKPAQSLYVLLFAALLLISQGLLATHHEGPTNKLVIQVSTDDPQTQAIAMNNAVNVQKAHGQRGG